MIFPCTANGRYWDVTANVWRVTDRVTPLSILTCWPLLIGNEGLEIDRYEGEEEYRKGGHGK